MADVDSTAVVDANKGLSICFIIGILGVNVALLYKIWQKNNKFFYNAKHLTLISLAVGDIFLALFSLIVTARLYFEPLSSYIDMGCRTAMSAQTYQAYLLPFVYGIGLCVLALEVAIRQKATTSSSSSGQQGHGLVKAFIFSAVPWFLGLVIILPLTMAGIDWNDGVCNYTDLTFSRARAMYWVSIILPAVLAFTSCLLIMCMRPSQHQPTQSMVLTPTAPTAAISTAGPPPPYPGNNDTYAVSKSSQQPSAVSAPGYNHCVYPQQNVGYQYPPQAPNQLPQNGPPQYHNVAYYPPSQPLAPQGSGFNTAPGYLPQSQPVSSATSATDPSKEKNILMWAALIFCFCVIPLAGFQLGYTLNVGRRHIWDEMALTVVIMLFQWLTIFRSLITPLLWLCSSTL